MKPYLSIVVTSRNDNHGGDLNLRTSNFLESIYFLSEKWNLDVEIIFVEWNPPSQKPLLKDVLPLPSKSSKSILRFIQVPEQIHLKYKNSGSIPLFQMIAKNVGIRRAEGSFVLCTNIDIIFSDEVFNFFSKKLCKPGIFYRANRCDVPDSVIQMKDFYEKLNYCKKNIKSRFGLSQDNEALRFVPFNVNWVYRFPKIAKFFNQQVVNFWKKRNNNAYPYIKIDFNACGDFTLMSKQDWMDIDGYVELDMYSIHVDSMALWSAIALNKKQFILDYKECVYHIEHENGWESEDIIKTIRFLENKPSLDYSIVEKGGKQILKEKRNWNLNKPDWGFAHEKFKEFIFEPGKEMREIN